MKVYDAASIRNVALVGHSGSGKTQLASAILSDAGMVNRFGKVDEGTTVTDFDEEEIARKHTLSASLAYAEWNKTQDQPDRHARHRQLPQRRPRRAAGGRCRRSSSSMRSSGVDGADREGLGGRRRARRCRGWSCSTGSIASAPASTRSLRVAARSLQPHGHPDSAADRRGEGVQGRRRSGHEEGVHLPDRRERQVHRGRDSRRTWRRPSTRPARRSSRWSRRPTRS